MTRARRPSPQTIAVLDALAAKASDWSHGYDLCRMLGLKAGTVYPILMRLADRGLVETAWEEDPPPGRPPRHLYRLSAAGAEHVRGLPRPEAAASRRAGRSGVAGRLAIGRELPGAGT
ncbi:MAG TPA: PadR family transcriptional regulator [Acidimicrobiales bacterium]|nr:PadR family transcriptional regulator [Acidimicrobiales bacterium]